jgi:hypothetical protein
VPADKVSFLDGENCDLGRGLLCAPDVFLEEKDFVPDVCASISDSEGRCLPNCIPVVAKQRFELPQSSCPEAYACVPCFDPIDGSESDACQFPGDPGPSTVPITYDKCCRTTGVGTLGTCVPSEILSTDLASALPQDVCREKDFVCVPDDMAGGLDSHLDSCVTQILQVPILGGCLPECFIEDPDLKDQLGQEECGIGELCTPCITLDSILPGACQS